MFLPGFLSSASLEMLSKYVPIHLHFHLRIVISIFFMSVFYWSSLAIQFSKVKTILWWFSDLKYIFLINMDYLKNNLIKTELVIKYLNNFLEKHFYFFYIFFSINVLGEMKCVQFFFSCFVFFFGLGC